MKYLSLVVGLLFCTSAYSEVIPPHCQLGTPNCQAYTGTMPYTGVHIHEPPYYFAIAGTHRAWLFPRTSKGTWRIRIMENWESTPYERAQKQGHYHQRKQSDLSRSGPIQYLEYNGIEAFYQQQIECEDDCANQVFDFIIEIPPMYQGAR